MEKLGIAENLHLTNENSSLRKTLQKLTDRQKPPEFEDLFAALSIAELQRERISFLIKELTYVQERKNALIEDEKIGTALKSLQNTENLEQRLSNARYKRQQLEMELENFERKKIRDLSEVKKNSARQDANLLLNL